MLLRSKSVLVPGVLLSKNKDDCSLYYYINFESYRIACQNVHNKLALLRPQAPIQRAPNLRKEGATMPEADYPMNRSPPGNAPRQFPNTSVRTMTSPSLIHLSERSNIQSTQPW